MDFLQETRQRFEQLRKTMTVQQIAAEAGTSFEWASKFGQGALENPTVRHLQAIFDLYERKRGPTPHKEIRALWAKHMPMCPQPRAWTPDREKLLRARWKEHPDLEWWDSFFEYLSESKFLTGKTEPTNGHRKFVATLPWVINASNFAKCQEGHYHRG